MGGAINDTRINIPAKLIGPEPVTGLRCQALCPGDALNRAEVGLQAGRHGGKSG